MLYSVYAIQSTIDNRIYVGLSKDPQKRLQGHNKGETKTTKGFRPWKLIYTKVVGSRIEARDEEKRLKSGYGKEFLRSLTKNIPQ
jgi:putative endonuclease